MANSPDTGIQVSYFTYYVLPQDAAGVQWVTSETVNTAEICADFISQINLASYGGYGTGGSIFLGVGLKGCNSADYVYVSLMNDLTGLGTGGEVGHSASETALPAPQPNFERPVNNTLASLLDENRIYSDGAVIYSLQHT